MTKIRHPRDKLEARPDAFDSHRTLMGLPGVLINIELVGEPLDGRRTFDIARGCCTHESFIELVAIASPQVRL